jgi:hypothetical protein
VIDPSKLPILSIGSLISPMLFLRIVGRGDMSALILHHEHAAIV